MATVIEKKVPPLVAGDKLSREEFLRRWQAQPDVKKAELIRGIVYMPSPLSVDHGDADANVSTWLGCYAVATPGTAVTSSATTFLLDSIPQPDQSLRIRPEFGGSTWVENNFLHGPPELIVEVCRSSAAYDLHVKLDLYESAKVPEYLAILLYEREIRWHVLDKGKYQVLAPAADGICRSQIFPGLWLHGSALLAGEMPQVLATLQDGLNSPDHQSFAAQLAAKKKP